MRQTATPLQFRACPHCGDPVVRLRETAGEFDIPITERDGLAHYAHAVFVEDEPVILMINPCPNFAFHRTARIRPSSSIPARFADESMCSN